MLNEEEYFAEIRRLANSAKKDIGQNFLIDCGISQKIITLADIKPGEKVLEIGPGAGSLSYYLSQTDAEIDLVDIDVSLITKLQTDFSTNERMHPIHGNALKWDLSGYQRIVGNLPYYITTSLIEKIAVFSKGLEKAISMIQKEAFCRIFSKIGSEDYGPLTVLLYTFYAYKNEMSVSNKSFLPVPQVSSVVFSLSPIRTETAEFKSDYLRMLKTAFAHRRKTIQNNISRFVGDTNKAQEVLSLCNIDLNRRPQDIRPDEYLSLFRLLSPDN